MSQQVQEDEYIGKDCPNEKPCVPQPCANFPLCGNAFFKNKNQNSRVFKVQVRKMWFRVKRECP
jgi:hypothetical protein